jgi:hypothetical protein
MSLELMIAAGIFAAILSAVGSAISTDATAARVLVAHVGPETRARSALERIATDLRMASEWGEDRNHDGQMQEGEDTNGNGFLDSCWSLGDGMSNQHTISFNRRTDLMDEKGELLASGVYSRDITYRVEGDRLVREWRRTVSDGTVQTVKSVMASGVLSITFARAGPLVTVQVSVRVPASISRNGVHSLATQVWLRN